MSPSEDPLLHLTEREAVGLQKDGEMWGIMGNVCILEYSTVLFVINLIFNSMKA